MEERRPLRRRSDDHHFGSLLVLAITAGAFMLAAWIATKALLSEDEVPVGEHLALTKRIVSVMASADPDFKP